jgi:D-3-phosphoglycerate dehydrogenase
MKILICDKLNSKVKSELETIGSCTDISALENKQEALMEEISDSEIVVIRSGTTLTEDVLQYAKVLKIIARCGVGVDNIDMSYTKARGKRKGRAHRVKAFIRVHDKK